MLCWRQWSAPRKQERYEQVVADFANPFARKYDAIYLSQASMLAAVDLCDHENVVTSPALGIKRLLEK